MIAKQILLIIIIPILSGFLVTKSDFRNNLEKISFSFFAGISIVIFSISLNTLFFKKITFHISMIFIVLISTIGFLININKYKNIEKVNINKLLIISLFISPILFYTVFRAYLYPIYGYDGIYEFIYRTKLISQYGYFNEHIFFDLHRNIATQSIASISPGIFYLVYFQNIFQSEYIFNSKLVFPLIYFFSVLMFFRYEDHIKFILLTQFFLFSFLYPIFFSTIAYIDLIISGMYLLIIILTLKSFNNKISYFLFCILTLGFSLFKAESKIYLIIICFFYILFSIKNKFYFKPGLVIIIVISILFSVFLTYHLFPNYKSDRVNMYLNNISTDKILSKNLIFFKNIFFNGTFLYLFVIFILIKPSNIGNDFIKKVILTSLIIIYFVFITMDNKGYLNRVFLQYFFTVFYYIQSEIRLYFTKSNIPQ